MKLYVNSLGEWVGTQAEAKKINAVQVEVPTDKPSLLNWLNNRHHVRVEPLIADAPVYQSNLTKPHAWQTIRECAEQADLKDLGVALAVLMNRLDEAADNVRH